MSKLEDNKSNLLALTVGKIYPFEWVRFDMYIEDNIYKTPPALVFRFRDEAKDQYDHLKQCIEQFEGNIRWTLYKSFFSRKNYVIEPLEFYFINKRLFEENKYPEIRKVMDDVKYRNICDNVKKDIPFLCEFIEKYFDIK